MRQRRGRVDRVHEGQGCSSLIGRVGRLRFARSAGIAAVCTAALAMPASAFACENERFRTGPSAGLPDCRAYELVTPADKGRTQDLTFRQGDYAAAAADGEAVALEALVPFGPNPSIDGTRAVFLRSPEGWAMKSTVAPGASEERFGFGGAAGLFSPDLSRVAFFSETATNSVNISENWTLAVGPVGGPYDPPAVSGPAKDEPIFLGASGTFNDVLFVTRDHELLGTRTWTDEHANDLYDVTEGHLELVDVESGPLTDSCGAELGGGYSDGEHTRSTVNAVARDGSKIFFTSPDSFAGEPSEPGCKEPVRLYMRVAGSETVEVSAPQGVVIGRSEYKSVRYNYATPDGAEVFFNTETPLTGETEEEEKTGLTNKLFEYNTVTNLLTVVARNVPAQIGVGAESNTGLIFSEDGSVVYVEEGGQGIYRYETTGGGSTFVATALEPSGNEEPSYATPNGEFFLFTSRGVEKPLEPRGQGHNELYRYDNATGSVICVSCGEGTVAPAEGEVIVPGAVLTTEDAVPAPVQISENGQQVFFQTTARLVPQDTNSTSYKADELNPAPGLDVYEWEADGTGGCNVSVGCTYLLSSGEASGASHFLGASRDGSNIFLATPARFAPEDTDEFDDIYDARVDGGFQPPTPAHECLSCQGVGSPPPLFSVPTSVSFAGADNPPVKPKPKPRKGARTKKKRHRRKSKAARPNGKFVRASTKGKRS
jgi:hypothetical protein